MKGDTQIGYPWRADPLTGGLETRNPPHRLDPSESPDLLNVQFSNQAAEKRGGFVPFIRKQPKLSCVSNRGQRGRMRIRRTTGAVDGDFLIVPGCLLGGHRGVYDQTIVSYTVEAFVRIDDLTTAHVGGGDTSGGAAVYWAASDAVPFPVVVRPILFKGPAKRTFDDFTTGPAAGGVIAWTSTNYWGIGPEACLPFGFYLRQRYDGGTFVAAGDWEFTVSWHSMRTATNEFELLTLRIPNATITPKVGVTYHLIFAITHGQTATLRVGVLGDDGTLPTYFTDTTIRDQGGAPITFTNYRFPTTPTTGPIQVFDCPQEFIEAPFLPSLTRPPGFGLSGANVGGYWYASKRFEGAIEDIVVWNVNKLTAGATTLDRYRKFDLAAQTATEINNYWSFTEEGLNYVKEMTGRGNHLYFVPAGPIYDETSGAPQSATKASWWFNGLTSYAMADLDYHVVTNLEESVIPTLRAIWLSGGIGNPSWRWYLQADDTVPVTTYARALAAMQQIVRNGLNHGLEVTFWPDSIEPRFEQVVMEIHSVLRLVITQDGLLRGYCRNDQAFGAAPTGLYSATFVQSPAGLRVVPGRRYTVALFRSGSGTSLDLWVNGQLIATVAVAAPSVDGALVSGITFGMGAYTFTGYTDQPAGAAPSLPEIAGSPNELNTDHRSGFMGRIESARVLCGNASLHPLYKDEVDADWQYEQSQLWGVPFTNTINAVIKPDFAALRNAGTDYENVANIGNGWAVGLPGHLLGLENSRYEIERHYIRYALLDTTNPSLYTLQGVTRDVEEGGFDGITSANPYAVYAAKLSTYLVFARFVFDKDDRDVQYAGNYRSGTEYGIASGIATQDVYRNVHVQISRVTDELGVMAGIEKRCLESDLNTQVFTFGSAPERSITPRGRPYRFRSPKELAPRWSPGLIRPLTSTTNISLIADFQHQASGESFVIVGCGRQLYWAKPSWRRDGPFGASGDYSLWGFGQPNDYCIVRDILGSKELTGTAGTLTKRTFEAWVKPTRIDGNRLLAFKGNPATPRLNYGIGFVDGGLLVYGSMAGATQAWLWREGTYTGATLRPEVTLKANAWNHVYVFMGNNGAGVGIVVAWINGLRLTMTATPATDALGGAAIDAASHPLYLMGLPQHTSAPRFPGATALQPEWKSWHGYVTEVRSTNVEEPAFSTNTGAQGFVPRARYADDNGVSNFYLLHCNEGAGWNLANSAVSASVDGGAVLLDELILLDANAEALEESRNARYDAAVYRDEMIVTNRIDRARRIQFTRFSDADGPFRVFQLGMQQPYAKDCGFVAFQKTLGTPFNVYDVDGTYDIWCTFVNALGEESEPTLIVRHFYTQAAFLEYAGYTISHLPRSPDPQVKTRRFYIGSSGAPLFHSDLEDNDSYEFQLFGLPSGDGLEAGVRAVPPRASLVTAASGRLFLGRLHETEQAKGGQNSFAVSDAASIAYWPIGNRATVDSSEGSPVTGIASHLGRLYLGKRDSIWQFEYGSGLQLADSNAFLRPNNESVGLGGGMTVWDNVIYGAGDRGIWRFDGANVAYASSSLEGDYPLFDLTDDGLQAMFGAYWRRNGHYWISVRRPGEAYNRFIYVLASGIGDKQVWSRWLVPEHTYMRNAKNPLTLEQMVLIGTQHGQVLRYSPAVNVDGMDQSNEYGGSTILQSTVGSSTTTSISITPAVVGQGFPTVGAGLRGCKLKVGTAEVTIESNTGTTLTWRGALAAAPTVGAEFVIGGYEAYWTSGWIQPQDLKGRYVLTKFIDTEFMPSACSLTFSHIGAINAVQSARAFPVSGFETVVIDLSTGYLSQPIHVDGTGYGRYVRIKFGHTGIGSPFAVTSFGLRHDDSGIRGGPT